MPVKTYNFIGLALTVIFNFKHKLCHILFFYSEKKTNSKRHEHYKITRLEGSNQMPYNEFDIIYQVTNEAWLLSFMKKINDEPEKPTQKSNKKKQIRLKLGKVAS